MDVNCRIALLGECMIEMRGQMFGAMHQHFGGDTLNTAVYLSRIGSEGGIRVCYATELGTDPYSQAMVNAWEEEGIDTSMVVREGGKMPGLYTIQVDEFGERTFYYWRDGSAARAYFDGPSSPLEESIDNLDALYYSGISLAVLPVAGRERLFAFIEKFRARGGKVYFDNNFRARLWLGDDAHTWYDRAFANCDLCLITLEDNAALYGLDEGSALAHAYSLLPDEVVIKRGVDPTLLRIRGMEPVVIQTYKVGRVVDTTGAGDSFAAGYLAARLLGNSPELAAKSGNKIASVVVQHPGAIIPRESMPVFFFS